MLSLNLVDFIQFEYNHTAIFARTALIDFFDLLEDHYAIGRLLPQSIEVFEYEPRFDDFRQANFVAIRRDLMDGLQRVGVAVART